MIASLFRFRALLPAATGALLAALSLNLAGCAGMGDSVSTAFADPAKYDLYNCKQLETERKTLAKRTGELQALMDKAQSGVAGPVVAEVAYRNDYIAVRGQSRNADEAWRRNKCHETPASEKSDVSTTQPANDRPIVRPSKSGSTIN